MQRLAAAAPVSAFLARCLHRVDSPLLRLSRGRLSVAGLLTGLPIGLLETRGARSGRWRAVPVLVINDGRRLALIASSYGRRRHPAWYYNLQAHPEAYLTLAGRRLRCLVRGAREAERAELWALAEALYPGFRAYARRAAPRRIPVLVLTPMEAQAGAMGGGGSC